jgi:ATPase family AAA domain-containing protein 3A/B
MFGGSNRRNANDSSLSSAMMPENAPKKSGSSSVTGFDPEGLERAAKAARELDASRNANQAIELIKTQEVTKQVRSCVCAKERERERERLW